MQRVWRIGPNNFAEGCGMGYHKCVIAGVLAVCALLSSDLPAGFAQEAKGSNRTFHNAEYGYSLSAPEGWMRIPDSAVQAYNAAMNGGRRGGPFTLVFPKNMIGDAFPRPGG